MRACLVYALMSSADNEIRYVGQTISGLARRRSEHINRAKRVHRPTHRDAWIRKVLREGHELVAVCLCDHAVRDRDEMQWIAFLRFSGFRLVNATGGGDGMTDASPELREKLSGSVAGLWADPEYRERQSLAHKGKPWSPARRAACDAVSAELRSDRARRGRAVLTPERRTAISSAAALAGRDKRRAARAG